MKRSLLVLLATMSLIAGAQDGFPYISHFSGIRGHDHQNWSISQDNHGVMLFANRHGLLAFDGFRWETKALPVTPVVLGSDSLANSIYVGTRRGFGKLDRDISGNILFNKLSHDTIDTGIITDIIFEKDKIVFYGESSVSVLDRETSQTTGYWSAKEDEIFTGAARINNNTYINLKGKGLHRIDSDTLFPIVTGYLTNDIEILFTLPYSENRILVGTSDNKLTLFDGLKYYDYKLSIDDYLDQYILNKGVSIDDSFYAFSTLYGGALIVDKNSGNVIHKVNYNTGLPDDEVHAIGTDNNNGLWLTHSYGISRVDFKLPVTNYTGFPGLEGNPIDTEVYNNRLYVATNTGLYILEEVKNYKDVEVFYKVNQVVTKPKPEVKEEVVEEIPEEKEPTRNVFKRLFRIKDKEIKEEVKPEEEVKDIEEKIEVPEVNEEVIQPVYRKKTVNELQSITWMYKKVVGIDTRCSRLINSPSGLFCISGTGVFRVEGQEASLIVQDRTINTLLVFNKQIVIASDNGMRLFENRGEDYIEQINAFNHNEVIYSLARSKNGNIWAGGNNTIYCFEPKEDNRYIEKDWYYLDSDFLEQCQIDIVNDTIFHFSESGIGYFSESEGAFIPYPGKNPGSNSVGEFILSQQGSPWSNFDGSWRLITSNSDTIVLLDRILKLFDDVVSINIDDKGNYWVIDENDGINKIDGGKQNLDDDNFSLFVTSISEEGGSLIDITRIDLDYGGILEINLSAPYYLKETTTEYQYLIEGTMKEWTKWSPTPEIRHGLGSGEHIMKIRAKNILGSITEEKTIQIYIKPPFTKSVWFYLIIGFTAIMILWFLSNQRQRKLRRDKKILEHKVYERTIEIENKKEQIEEQRDKILRQNDEITSSITYARRIQEAIFPEKTILEKNIAEHFIFFKPRDIVSGDFYWIAESKSFFYFAVADCTGHGVPGAIMSMLGISLLNEITEEGTIDLETGEILDRLRNKIISSLAHTGRDQQATDGMDITLIKYIRKSHTVQVSGAFNPLYHFRDNMLTEYKTDRMPIGYFEKSSNFKSEEFKIKKGDTLYLFSDGYYDQFGGPNDKKFSSKNLRITLTGIVDMSMSDQTRFLENRFQEWRGKNEQVDDILIAGLRIV